MVGVPVKTLPGLHELISGDVNLAGQIRPVQVEDVLGRQQVEVDLQAVAAYVREKTVLVTGAGGSIGSELSRQLARLGAARLVLVDKGESALFEIERELVDERDFPAAIPVLADIGDSAKMRQVFERYHPQVVFHAAAYKHVGMLEANPLQAVSNNVLGTRSLAEVAVEAGVERFVLISTDKAANPKNVMGQSKAVCEWIVESFALHPEVETRFVAVRFGNVLGSSGSVIPIFRRQIERGGPVTVTNPEMTRFFMTIPEASSLVVQAGAMGGRGQVYVLDMGEPVRILDLAKQMIRLSGRREEDIPIVFTGSRAGEKVHEVLWNEGEAVGPTSHPKIMRAARPQIDAAWLAEALAELERLVEDGNTLGVVAKLASMSAEPLRTDAHRFWKTRCTDVTGARRTRGYGASVDVLEGLNPEQRRAAEAVRGPVCILAGAGSGKTTTITRRIAQQVATGAFEPAQIMAVTFTDKAAGELKTRLAALGVRGVRASTFHSAALRQLRHFAPEEVGRILPSKALALRQIANGLPGAYRFRPAGDLATEIEWAKNRRIGPEDYRREAAEREPPIPLDLMHRVFRDYERRKAADGLLDFEDLLERTVQLFERDDAVRSTFCAQYRAFTVDEYQDVNLLQQTLLDLWLGDRDDLCVVGDDYQSIYAFTGAGPEHLLGVPAGSRTRGRAPRGELPLDAASARVREPARAEPRRRGEGAASRARRRPRPRRAAVCLAGRGRRGDRRADPRRSTARSRRSRSWRARTPG